MLTAESEHEVWKRFVEWRKDLELRGLKVNIKKTKQFEYILISQYSKHVPNIQI